MAPLIRAALVLALGVAVFGCRDMVEPGVVASVSSVRAVQGRLDGIDGLDMIGATVWFDTVAYGDTTTNSGRWTVGIDPDGTFETFVPRGTDTQALVRFRWPQAGGRTASFTFVDVDLGTTELRLDLGARRVTGQVVLPDEYGPVDWSMADLTFVRPEGTTGDRSWWGALDENGRFDLVMPGGRWDVACVYPFVGASTRDFELFSFDTEVTEDMVVEPALASRWIRLRGPAGFPIEAIVLRSEENVFRFGNEPRVFTHFTLDGPAQRAWLFQDSDRVSWFYSVTEAVEDDVAWVGLRARGIELLAASATDTVELSIGEHIVRFAVERDGYPASNARLRLYSVEGDIDERLNVQGWLDCAVFEGSAQVLVDDDEGPEFVTWVDVNGPGLITIDLTAETVEYGP